MISLEIPPAEWVDELLAKMTVREKVSQLMHEAPAIERLGIPAYNWRNECLHGVARAGIATVFPQAIALAATFNVGLMHEVANVISEEARAKHHQAVREGKFLRNFGLTFWSPNINIARDPRWGRAQETYGEDPYLTSRMAVAHIKGLQGDDPTYLKVVATAKHFAVHSGPECLRHSFDASATKQDLADTYLPAFEAAVKEGKSYSVMSAYNRTNGEACSASPYLIQDILREKWGFEGYVTTDCDAVDDLFKGHGLAADAPEAAAMCLNAGSDLECGCVFGALLEAVERGLVSEETLDQAVKRLFVARQKLGMFDSPSEVRYARIPIEVNDCEEHRALALKAARESMVLLKNDGILPLSKGLSSIAVIGPHANNPEILLGNYHGTPSSSVTPFEGIKAKLGDTCKVSTAKGCTVASLDKSGFEEALSVAAQAELIVFVGGLNQVLEGEEDQDEGVPIGTISQGDRLELDLPGVQEDLLKQLYKTGKPVILVLFNGSNVAVEWADAHLPAILEAWYPGQAGGTAIADVLFGGYNPAGRLPVTFYRSSSDLPPIEDYTMEGRTYRYFEGEPLYPFGYGLSYTQFNYAGLKLSAPELDGESLKVTATVKNVGQVAGDEVVQLYLSHIQPAIRAPKCRLAGFKRISLEPGEEQLVFFELTEKQFALADEEGRYVIESAKVAVSIGNSQPCTNGYRGETAIISIRTSRTLVGESPLG